MFFISMLLSLAGHSQLTAKQIKASPSTNNLTVGFMEYLPADYGSQAHPLIIFLHGIGERGASGIVPGTDATSAKAVLANEIPKYLAAGGTLKFTVNCKPSSFVVLAPQLYSNYWSWENFYTDEMLKYAKQNLRIDTNRIYLTGLSLGGGGVWKYVTTSLANARQFAAIAPVCGTCEWSNLCNTVAAANLPVWAFHAQDDGTVGVGCTNGAIASLLACNPLVKPLVTIYPNGNHWIWNRSYDTTHAYQSPNVFEWFLTNERKPPAVSSPPPPAATFFADAGPDQTVSGTTATLNAANSKGYKSAWGVYWELLDHPAGRDTWNVFPMFNRIGTQLTVQNLVKGVYRFRVTIENDKGDKASDEVLITVK